MSTGLAIFTAVHVVISLAGIGSGLVVLNGLLTARNLEGWTRIFLATTLATSVTGFGFSVRETAAVSHCRSALDRGAGIGDRGPLVVISEGSDPEDHFDCREIAPRSPVRRT